MRLVQFIAIPSLAYYGSYLVLSKCMFLSSQPAAIRHSQSPICSHLHSLHTLNPTISSRRHSSMHLIALLTPTWHESRSKVYFNALLTTLNSRERRRRGRDGITLSSLRVSDSSRARLTNDVGVNPKESTVRKSLSHAPLSSPLSLCYPNFHSSRRLSASSLKIRPLSRSPFA